MPFGLSVLAGKAIAWGALALLLLLGFAWFVHSERNIGAAQVRAEVAKAQAVEHAKTMAESRRNDDLAARLATAQATEKVIYATRTRMVDRLVDRPVFRRDCLDADGVRLANDALTRAPPDPGLAASAVPGAAAP